MVAVPTLLAKLWSKIASFFLWVPYEDLGRSWSCCCCCCCVWERSFLWRIFFSEVWPESLEQQVGKERKRGWWVVVCSRRGDESGGHKVPLGSRRFTNGRSFYIPGECGSSEWICPAGGSFFTRSFSSFLWIIVGSQQEELCSLLLTSIRCKIISSFPISKRKNKIVVVVVFVVILFFWEKIGNIHREGRRVAKGFSEPKIILAWRNQAHQSLTLSLQISGFPTLFLAQLKGPITMLVLKANKP